MNGGGGMNKFSKSAIAILLIFVSVLVLPSCTVQEGLIRVGISGICCMADYFMPPDKNILDLPEYVDCDSYVDGGFQDWTYYAKHYYDGIDEEILDNNEYFNPVTEESIPEIKKYVNEFDSWNTEISPSSNVGQNYDFDKSIIEVGDYFYINDKTPDSDMFSVYYFDIEAQTLYWLESKW